MTLKTLADLRELMRHLPEDRRSRPTWRQVAADIEAAAGGGETWKAQRLPCAWC
jgi:hypothetical protein